MKSSTGGTSFDENWGVNPSGFDLLSRKRPIAAQKKKALALWQREKKETSYIVSERNLEFFPGVDRGGELPK